MSRILFVSSLLGSVALLCGPVLADEDVTPRYSTKGIYTTHAPDTVVHGRFHAGPCQYGPYSSENKSAQYEAGVDVHGNPVVPADVPENRDSYRRGLRFGYEVARVPRAIENRYGLIPQDYIEVDTVDGTVTYNSVPLAETGDLPPAPGLCE